MEFYIVNIHDVIILVLDEVRDLIARLVSRYTFGTDLCLDTIVFNTTAVRVVPMDGNNLGTFPAV